MTGVGQVFEGAVPEQDGRTDVRLRPGTDVPGRPGPPAASAVDETTRTLYAADPTAGTIAVVNTAACNAATTTGCAQHPPVIKIGASPNTPGHSASL